MASSPRIVTVDPNDLIPQQLDAAFTLMDRYVTTIKVLHPDDALEEVEYGRVDAVVASWRLGNGVQGWELAAHVHEINPEMPIILLGDYDDPEPDDEALEQSVFVYLKRPYDLMQFIRVLEAALGGGNIFSAQYEKKVANVDRQDFGPVPELNVRSGGQILRKLLQELNATTIILATRTGDILAEEGTVGHLEREALTHTLLPALLTTIELRDTIGGNASSLQYFDGDDTDIYVISVGLHHFLAILFDGVNGGRQLGPVRTFGRRAAEDLIGILGAEAWFFQPAITGDLEPEPIARKPQRRVEEEQPQLERAQLETVPAVDDSAPVEVQAVQMDAIDDLDFDSLFSEDTTAEDAGDLFNLDAMEELAKEAGEGRKGTLDWEAAKDLGLLPD